MNSCSLIKIVNKILNFFIKLCIIDNISPITQLIDKKLDLGTEISALFPPFIHVDFWKPYNNNDVITINRTKPGIF